MSIRIDSTPLIADSFIVGDGGLGVLAEDVPNTGEHGAGFIYNDLDLPADNGKEVRGLITTWPTNGTLFAYEDSSFYYEGTTDTFQYQLYVDGVAVGSPTTVYLNVGGAVINGSLALSETVTYPATVQVSVSIEATHASIQTTAYAATITLGSELVVNATFAASQTQTYEAVVNAAIEISASYAETQTIAHRASIQFGSTETPTWRKLSIESEIRTLTVGP